MIDLRPALWLSLALTAGCGGSAPPPDGGGGGTDAPATVDVPTLLGDAPASDLVEVELVTTEGTIVLELHRSWAPIGVQHFLDLVALGYYDDTRFFRVIAGFVAQFGISGDPTLAATWNDTAIADDPVATSNAAGTVSYASLGTPNSRSAQLFINLANNAFLDSMGFAPIGRITSGLDAAMRLTSEYGEAPDQGRIVAEGNAYLDASFPNLDQIITARVR